MNKTHLRRAGLCALALATISIEASSQNAGGTRAPAGGSSYCAIADKNRVMVSMAEYPGAMRNPMKGFREFFMRGSDRRRPAYPYPFGSMIKEYMPWNMLERDAGDSVATVVACSNRLWAGVEEQNVKVIPRVFIVWMEPWHGGQAKNPHNPYDLNGWHWPADMPGETGPYRQRPGSPGAYVEEADSLACISGGYFDPRFPDRVRALVRKLGQAWDNDPRVAYVEMGIIGEWGEHHDPDLSTVYPPHDEPRHVAGRTWIPGMQKVLGDAFREAFRNKKVMVRYAYEFNDYDFGIYWDSWAQPEEEGRGYREMLHRGDYWRNCPVGGEITWNWGTLQLNGFRSLEDCLKDSLTFSRTMEQVRNLHCNHLGGVTWADFSDSLFMARAGELQKAMGYRFVMTQATFPRQLKRGRRFRVGIEVENRGSSPFYYDWPVELALLDARSRQPVWKKKFSRAHISAWMPGEDWDSRAGAYRLQPAGNRLCGSFRLPQEVKSGTYILAVGILDPACNRPTLRFANTNYLQGGYHPLGYVGVGCSPERVELPTTEFYDLQADTTLNYAKDYKQD